MQTGKFVHFALAAALASTFAATSFPARADGGDEDPYAVAGAGGVLAANPAPSAPQPAVSAADEAAGADKRFHLNAEDLARKNDGGYVTAFPLAAYDPTIGFGVGARAYYYYDGKRTDPLFPVTPYLDRVFVQAYVSTRGVQDHLIDYDSPSFLGTPYRARATLEYQAVNQRPYFGIGARTMNQLSFPGAARTYAHASDYDRATQAIQPNGTTYAEYNAVRERRPLLQLAMERLLLGGVVRPLIGLGFAYNAIDDVSGEQVDGVGTNGATVKAPEAQTLFKSDCAAHRIVGCQGGWDNVLRVALSIDTRDFEPDPNSGWYVEFSNEFGSRALGSQYDYARSMLSVRGFYSPFPRLADLVLAGRAVYEIQSSGTPWVSEDNLPFIDDNHYGLGGGRTLRGYRQDRFVGPVMALGNAEIRWTFYRLKVAEQKFAFIAVPFVDTGRVWDRVADTNFKKWAASEGGGLHVAWNDATVVVFDYGVSKEDSGLYIDFNHTF